MLDVDGVLIKGRPSDCHVWTHKLYDDLGVDPDLLAQEFFSGEWQAVVTGKRDLHPTLSHSLKRLGTNVTAQELISYWFEMDSRIIQSVLRDCRVARRCGYQIYLATNQEHLRAQYLMETLGLTAEMDGIIYSAEAGFQKPHPAFFSHAAEMTRHAPSELLLIDDTQINIDGAKRAGWRAVHWDGSQQLGAILRRCIEQFRLKD